jgi:zinc transport system substrate-binding protein
MRAVAAAVALCALAVGAGCAADDDEAGARGGTVRVVAGFYPLAEAASRVLGDRGDVRNLTAAGVEPHDVELSPDDVDDVLDADLVLYLGEGFQPALEDTAPRAEGEAVDLLDGQNLADDADPHVWLDPTRMIDITERIRDAAVDVDPDGAAGHRRRAGRYVADLEALDAAFERGLRGCERDTIVTSHAAFGYLADRYGLSQLAISGLSPAAEPSPERLADLADLMRREGVTTVFYESLVSPRVAETLADEAGAEVAVLDPLEGLSEEQADAGA